jgi:hypothetical protein
MRIQVPKMHINSQIDTRKMCYNFVRKHESVKQTPAEKAGVNLELGNNKIENLIKLASRTKKQLTSV